MRDVLIRRYGVDEADSVLHEAGKVAGSSFCKNALDTGRALNEFVADLKDKLLALKIGVLQIEKADLDSMEFILTVSEDLDCSGLPATDETVCTFDEGFIAGILGTYLGREFEVKEIDCWATGERTCRFQAVARS